MIFALIIIISYILISILKYKKVPDSISDTFYLGNDWWFTVVMVILGVLICINLISITSENYQFLSFLIGTSLLFVGAAPHFKEEFERKVHYGSAIVFALTSQIWASLYYSPLILLTWILSIVWINTKQRTFWGEITCIINLALAYFLGTL